MEIYLTAEVPMGINIDQLRVQRNRYQMTPSSVQEKLFLYVEIVLLFFNIGYIANMDHACL